MTHSPTNQMYSSLQCAYDHFNQSLFEGRLPEVLIVLQRKAKTMGYVSYGRWRNGAGNFTDELAVNPEYFLGYPLMEVFQTLCHEQCHVWQRHFGKPGRRGYHNKQWADKMVEIGLMPSHNGKPGGRRTGERMSDYPSVDGLFYKACCELLEQDYALPWLDRRPLPVRGSQHAVYDSQGRIVQIEPTPATLSLFLPLGSSIDHAREALRMVQNNVVPINQNAHQATTSFGEEMDEVGENVDAGQSESPSPESAGAMLAAQGVTSISINLPNSVYTPPDLVPIESAAKKATRSKYRCGCSNNIWGKAGLKITCDECKQPFKVVE